MSKEYPEEINNKSINYFYEKKMILGNQFHIHFLLVRKPKYSKDVDDTVQYLTKGIFERILHVRKFVKSELYSLDGKVINLKYEDYSWRFLASGKNSIDYILKLTILKTIF